MPELTRFIFIVGMPGSGKSTIGKLLAVTLKVPFYDLDKLIEKESEMSVSNFFETFGEEKFRLLESELLRQTIEFPGPAGIISTGGGTPCFHDSMKWMNEHGKTIFLDVPLTILIERTEAGAHRPLLGDSHEEKLLALYNRRYPVYQQASIRIPFDEQYTAHAMVGKIVDQIVKLP